MKKKSHGFLWLYQIQIPFELEESLSWKLESFGITSYSFEHGPEELSLQTLSIWLPDSEWSINDKKELISSFIPLAEIFGIDLPASKWQKINDEEWNEAWKKYWLPDPIGNHLLILPAWLDIPKGVDGRKVVRMDPGTAFGSGSHPSTRLCLEALDRNKPLNKTVVDLGCGSGILGLTALAFGAQKVYAADIDCLAVSSTRNNFLLNDFDEDTLTILNGSLEILQTKLQQNKVDLLLCNILAPVISKLSVDFNQILRRDGRALLSGILLSQMSELSEVLRSNGWKISKYWEKENWGLIEIYGD
ncbi:50S ribosomal protein L11 methyltransferase [Prochlorococcus sp. MIT 1223]|uniref:50S ribosomal protein L11 methyltransferase n=1 Tax=Prochlorococcus sp. MIT 1223 TaxID=3096217 RepID=UPI002A76523F|nr:50S ribosomal protein L11 methyltransferase [Prochlorococcus sp. MIT 1223]